MKDVCVPLVSDLNPPLCLADTANDALPITLQLLGTSIKLLLCELLGCFYIFFDSQSDPPPRLSPTRRQQLPVSRVQTPDHNRLMPPRLPWFLFWRHHSPARAAFPARAKTRRGQRLRHQELPRSLVSPRLRRQRLPRSLVPPRLRRQRLPSRRDLCRRYLCPPPLVAKATDSLLLAVGAVAERRRLPGGPCRRRELGPAPAVGVGAEEVAPAVGVLVLRRRWGLRPAPAVEVAAADV